MSKKAINEMSAEERVLFEAFNDSVTVGIRRMTDLSRQMLDEGTSATATALSNALTAADVVAAIASESGEGEELIKAMMGDLAIDMMARASQSFKVFSDAKLAESDAETVDA